MLARLTRVLPVILFLASGGAISQGQNYPNKPIRFVAPSAGGFADLSSRLLQKGLNAKYGWTAYVENKGAVAVDTAVNAAPDGHSLIVYGNPLWLGKLIHPELPYDPIEVLAPLTMTTRTPNILITTLSLPVKTVADLIAYAKARPGQVNYAHGVELDTPKLAAELFKSMAGIDMVGVSYKGTGDANNGLIRGDTHVMFANATTYTLVKAGKARALAVTSLRPTPVVADLPTVAASGLPGYDVETYTAAFAPVKTPEPIRKRLGDALVAVLKDPEINKAFLDLGAEPIPGTPEEATAAIRGEINKMGKVIRDLGPQH